MLSRILEESIRINDNELAGMVINIQNILIRTKDNLKLVIEELDIIDKCPHYVPISAKDEWNFDELMQKIWEYLDLIRIYTKPKGQIPDYDAPVIIKNGASISDFC